MFLLACVRFYPVHKHAVRTPWATNALIAIAGGVPEEKLYKCWQTATHLYQAPGIKARQGLRIPAAAQNQIIAAMQYPKQVKLERKSIKIPQTMPVFVDIPPTLLGS